MQPDTSPDLLAVEDLRALVDHTGLTLHVGISRHDGTPPTASDHTHVRALLVAWGSQTGDAALAAVTGLPSTVASPGWRPGAVPYRITGRRPRATPQLQWCSLTPNGRSRSVPS